MSQAETEPKNQPVPWVTLGLIAANMAVAVVAMIDPDAFRGFTFDPHKPSPVSAFSSLFLHANLIHLLGNMVFLAAVGPKVESVAGRWAYVTVYFGGGIAGVLAHWGVMSAIGGSSPLLGASGAIASCVGYCAVRFMNRKVPLAPKLHVTVGAVTLLWLGIQALGAFVKFGGELAGGAAFWTHLAGFGAGLALSVVFKAPQQASLQFGHEVLDKMSDRGPAAVLQAAERHLELHSDDTKALRDMANALHQMGEYDREAQALTRLLGAVPVAAQPTVLEDLGFADGWKSLSAIERLRLAETHKTEHLDLAKRLAKSVADDPKCDVHHPDALLALAELEIGEAREPFLAELVQKHALHTATEIARQKGLIR